jgi:acyl-coenzyme A synthetase/AMP-(fatty) acid ligase
MGYADARVDLEKGDERGGVLLTGDTAFRDADGYYYVTGRISRFVKVFGKRVSLDDVEQLSMSVVREAACLGVDDEISIWTTESDKQTQLRQFLAQRTGIHQSAYAVHVCDALPRTAAGKVDYQKLPLGESK